GFNPSSHSAQLVEAVREARLRMVWNDATHAEIEHVMRQIPRLSWARIADLFRSEDRFGGSTHPEAFGFVPDPADRKFAALADAVQAPLVTSDAGLLSAGGQMAVPVLKPGEFARRCGALNSESGLHWHVDEPAGELPACLTVGSPLAGIERFVPAYHRPRSYQPPPPDRGRLRLS